MCMLWHAICAGWWHEDFVSCGLMGVGCVLGDVSVRELVS